MNERKKMKIAPVFAVAVVLLFGISMMSSLAKADDGTWWGPFSGTAIKSYIVGSGQGSSTDPIAPSVDLSTGTCKVEIKSTGVSGWPLGEGYKWTYAKVGIDNIQFYQSGNEYVYFSATWKISWAAQGLTNGCESHINVYATILDVSTGQTIASASNAVANYVGSFQKSGTNELHQVLTTCTLTGGDTYRMTTWVECQTKASDGVSAAYADIGSSSHYAQLLDLCISNPD